jgi:arsenate reductase-like glutaredoxin family protein
MSVKWLCNTGTHGRRITHEELLDAYEIYEFCLEEIIEEKSKKIAQLAAKLNEKHNNAKVTGAKE